MEQNPSLCSGISTMVPSTPCGDENREFCLSNMDLAMKLHYIRAVYFFTAEAAQGLSILDLKEPMCLLLPKMPHVPGRVRIFESGRPFIKCNDAGVRSVESHHGETLEEWLHQNGYSIEGLVHDDHVLGPDLGFSPLVFVKFNWFKCGGLGVGLSWSHIIGDAISAFNFITMWSQILADQVPPKSLPMTNTKETRLIHSLASENPISMKKTTIIGESWITTNENKMVTHSFYFTSKQIDHLVTTMSSGGENYQTTKSSYFDIISALLWKYIACIKQDFEPKVVTICTYGSNSREKEYPTNGLVVLSMVKANVAIDKSDVLDLARLIAEEKMVENHVIEKFIEESKGKEDFIVYGANLTFVDLEEANIYGVKMNGKKPILVNCTFHGVGEQGVVLVLPAPSDDKNGSSGRIITVSLPEKELNQLKDKLGGELGIASHPL